jgi:hypothetical protein
MELLSNMVRINILICKMADPARRNIEKSE